tara:strand:+ start:111 stop:380 length:270 start_codon:yes stop_codon:yes gene_type:complete
MIRETSRVAYEDLKVSGKRLTQKEKIVKLLREKDTPLSRKEISTMIDMEINAVSGRVNDLLKEGKLKEAKSRKCFISRKTIKPVFALPF